MSDRDTPGMHAALTAAVNRCTVTPMNNNGTQTIVPIIYRDRVLADRLADLAEEDLAKQAEVA